MNRYCENSEKLRDIRNVNALKTKEYAYCEQCGQRIDKIEYVVNGCVCNACFDVNNELD